MAFVLTSSKISLELGGKSPHLVFESADLEQGQLHHLASEFSLVFGSEKHHKLDPFILTVLLSRRLPEVVVEFV